MDLNPLTSCIVELLYDRPPALDAGLIRRALQTRGGRVDLLGKSDDFYGYAFPDHTSNLAGGRVPVQLILFFQKPKSERPDLTAAIEQSWGWPEAGQAVSTLPVSLLAVEMMAQGMAREPRLALFHNALEALVTVVPCRALHWVNSQQLVPLEHYLQWRQAADFHPLQGVLNVRFFKVGDGRPGEMLMDTLGLVTLGLPDLQCHFTGLAPKEVASVLYQVAYYLFDEGDVIRDGDTVPGAGPGTRWRCRHEMSLVDPMRPVVDLDPGKPFAAGQRKP